MRLSPDKTMVFFTSNLFGASYVFGVGVKEAENPTPADVKDTAEPGRNPGLLIYVVTTAEAAVGSTGALRRRMAAEMRVMIRPTGRGSMKV